MQNFVRAEKAQITTSALTAGVNEEETFSRQFGVSKLPLQRDRVVLHKKTILRS